MHMHMQCEAQACTSRNCGLIRAKPLQEWAEEPSQKYKEGKYIIERSKVLFNKSEGETVDYCPLSFADMTPDSEIEEDGC